MKQPSLKTLLRRLMRLNEQNKNSKSEETNIILGLIAKLRTLKKDGKQ